MDDEPVVELELDDAPEVGPGPPPAPRRWGIDVLAAAFAAAAAFALLLAYAAADAGPAAVILFGGLFVACVALSLGLFARNGWARLGALALLLLWMFVEGIRTWGLIANLADLANVVAAERFTWSFVWTLARLALNVWAGGYLLVPEVAAAFRRGPGGASAAAFTAALRRLWREGRSAAWRAVRGTDGRRRLSGVAVTLALLAAIYTLAYGGMTLALLSGRGPDRRAGVELLVASPFVLALAPAAVWAPRFLARAGLAALAAEAALFLTIVLALGGETDKVIPFAGLFMTPLAVLTAGAWFESRRAARRPPPDDGPADLVWSD